MPKSVPLDTGRVLLDIEVGAWFDLLRIMCEKVLAVEGVDAQETAEELAARIMNREGQRSHMVADGTACINVRLEGLDGVRVCFARPVKPVTDGPDGQRVQLAILIASPQARPTFGMRVTAEFESLCKDAQKHGYMMQETSTHALRDWLDDRLREDDSPITAGEIMRPSSGQVSPDIGLPDLTQLMVAHNLDAVGITTDDRRLVGQVSADDLFTLGMPDFFRQLKSIAFIAEFDPLERYFSREKELTAREVMSEDYAAVPPDATILEVLFFLSVKGYQKVYVVDEEGLLLGVIDRIRLIDHVLHF